MSLCRVIGLQSGIRYRSKNTSGVWRTLSEGDSLVTGESIEVFSGGAHFGDTVCKIQNRVSGAWADALILQLDLTQGTSHTRKDLLTITGDATDSTVTAVTYGKGHGILKATHDAQLDAENKRGIMFEWKDELWSGVLSEVDRGKDAGKGGYLEEADARLVAHRSQFVKSGVAPLPGNKIFADGESYQIVDPISVGDVAYTFELRRCNRG